MEKNPDPGSGYWIQDKNPEPYFRELLYLQLYGVIKILKFFVADLDLRSGTCLALDPGSWMEKLGSATLLAIFVKFGLFFSPATVQ